jgi:hypothetical protein
MLLTTTGLYSWPMAYLFSAKKEKNVDNYETKEKRPTIEWRHDNQPNDTQHKSKKLVLCV